LRISVGIEHTPDLISDVAAALARASRATLGVVGYA
jgi:cystathionine beta-lyase/cystathionine gamma-synthase